LLYYQAFLLTPELDNQAILDKIYDVYGGAEPDTQTRTFLGKCLPAFELFEIASLMTQCTWGVWSEAQNSRIFLLRKLRHLSNIISVDASTLSADGHYRAALEQCLTLRRIVRHVSEEPELILFQIAFDGIALRTIRRILGEMPLDADVLAWFQGQLAMFQEATTFLERTLQEYLEYKIDMVQSSSIASLRDMLLKRAADERAKQNVRDLTDEQIRAQAIETVQGLFGSVSAILHSDKSAEQKRAEIQELTKHTVKTDIPKLFIMLTMLHDELGKDILGLIVRIGPEMTEEQKLSKMQKIIDKRVAPDAIKLLTKLSNALGREIDLGFLAGGEMTDEQRLAEMQKVLYELGEAYRIENSKFGFSWEFIMINSLFKSQVRHTAQINSIKAAVDVYLVLAKTGQLPEKLPDHLPKDPYSSKDFEYETTKEGFVLRCRVKPIDEREVRQYEFKVQR
jgi:predicted nucleotidyltransferase